MAFRRFAEPDRGPVAGSALAARYPLTREMPAATAMAVIHRVLIAKVIANEEGVRDDRGAEPLHDFRVAVRRARTALTRVKAVFDRARTRHLRTELAWLGRATGPRRDLDVLLETLPEYAAELSAANRRGIGAVQRALTSGRAAAQSHLENALVSDRYRRLLGDWQRLADPGAAGAVAAERPIEELACECTARALDRVTERGDALDGQSPASSVHALRIEAKKLRYLLEFFAGLAEPQRVGDTIRGLKRLQDHLGVFQDYTVQLGLLHSDGDLPQRRPAAPLVALLVARQAAVRGRVAAAWGPLAATLKEIDPQRLYRGA